MSSFLASQVLCEKVVSVFNRRSQTCMIFGIEIVPERPLLVWHQHPLVTLAELLGQVLDLGSLSLEVRSEKSLLALRRG
jgi:hypothetical protein